MNPQFPLTGPDPAFLPNGQPRPVCPQTGLPLMTQMEANWHSHVSGVAAREQALAAAGDPAATSSMVIGAAWARADMLDVAGIPMRPLSIGTFLALEKLGSVYAAENADGSPMVVKQLDIALAALVFQRPEWAYELLEAGQIAELKRAAVELSFSMTAPVLNAVNVFINGQMQEFFGEATPEKKSNSPESEPSPAPPPSPEPAEAPSADGLPPSSNS